MTEVVPGANPTGVIGREAAGRNDAMDMRVVRPEVGSDVEIPKTKVLAIEEARRWTKPMITFL